MNRKSNSDSYQKNEKSILLLDLTYFQYPPGGLHGVNINQKLSFEIC